MAEYLRAECPQCKEELKVRHEYVGRRVECRRCKHTFEISREDHSISKSAESVAPEIEAAGTSELAEKLKSDNLRLREQRAALRLNVEVLRSKLESSHAARESVATLQAEIDGLKQALTSSQMEAARTRELEKEIDELQLSLKESLGNADRALAIDRQLLGLQNELETARTALTQMASLERERNAFDQELAEARSEAERGARVIQELEILRNEYEGASAQHALTLEASTRLGLESEDLRRKLDEQRQALQEELTTTRGEYEAARRDWHSEKKSLEELGESRVRQYLEETQTLRSKLNELNSELVELKAGYEEQRSRHDETTSRMESESEKSHAALMSREAQLVHEVEEHNRTKAVHDERMSAKVDAVRGAEELNRIIESRLETLAKEAENLREGKEELLKQLDRERLLRAEETQAKYVQLAAVHADREREKQSWSTERDDLAAQSTHHQKDSGEQIDRLRAAEDRAGQLLEELRLASAARDEHENALQQIGVELAELKVAFANSQDFKHQIKSFLSGLGIKLPS